MRIAFTIPGTPVAKGRARACVRRRGARVFAGSYTPEKTRIAEQTLAARAMEHRPARPLSGPLRVEFMFVLPIPKSWPSWQRFAAENATYLHVSKPDLSNLLKLAEDALNEVFWLDDAQICEFIVIKQYGANPQTRIVIEELEQAQRKAG